MAISEQKSNVLDFTDDTDADLLAYMAMQEEDPSASRQAWAELFRRHSRFLYSQFFYRGDIRTRNNREICEELIHDTFLRAYKYAHTFRDQDVEDPERLSRICRAWLVKIAQRILFDYGHSSSIQADCPIHEHAIDIPEEPSSQFELAQLAAEAIGRLDEREQDIIRVWLEHYKLGEEHQRLPNKVSQEIAARWQTTPQYIRTLRMRALDKIRRDLEKHLARRSTER